MAQVSKRLVQVAQLVHLRLLVLLLFIFLELVAVNELLTVGFIWVECVHQIAVAQHE